MAALMWSSLQTYQRMTRLNPALQGALQMMREAPRGIAILGQPIESHESMVRFAERGRSVFAEIKVSVSGPKDSGLLIAEAVKQDGVWRTTKLVLTVKDQSSPIDLLSPMVDKTIAREHPKATR
jgi:hypothetical protein